jgi:hypothetical protein
MAFKRKTKKTGTNSRSSVTYNTGGPSTFSSSNSANGVTYTTTSKGGKYYTTRTQRSADGYIERKRIMSSVQKSKPGSQKSKPRSKRRREDSSFSGNGLVFFVAFVMGLWCLSLIFWSLKRNCSSGTQHASVRSNIKWRNFWFSWKIQQQASGKRHADTSRWGAWFWFHDYWNKMWWMIFFCGYVFSDKKSLWIIRS